jgi:uncharacterized Zn ribbon protein
MKRVRKLTIGVITYWNLGSDLGACDECGNKAFSYNENGDLFCKKCLVEWHEKQNTALPESVEEL